MVRKLMHCLGLVWSVLSHVARCKANAWHPFGYVQPLLRSKQTKLNGAAKAKNCHAQLQAMRQGLQQVQTGVDSRLKMLKYIVLENVSILFIAADTPAADKLCAHFSSYGKGVKHVTCSCNVPFDKMDDPDFCCSPITWNAMHTIAT
jgi:hypothetical protein